MTTIVSPKGNITIRLATIHDTQAFIALRLKALKDHPEAFGSDYEDALARPDEFWQQRLTESDYNAIYVAVSPEAELIGMTGISRYEGKKIQHNASIVSVYIDPAWRGLRLTEHLIETCVEWARRHDVRILRLGVAVTNTAAIRAYTRAGFSIYGIEQEVIFTGGVYYDELSMARRL
ncbi:MAG: GNAT family N-acetyltransferase [Chloroflexota bacterium]|nr:GNAT family N-acetyltransferase [Chloroflexota bacterium]